LIPLKANSTRTATPTLRAPSNMKLRKLDNKALYLMQTPKPKPKKSSGLRKKRKMKPRDWLTYKLDRRKEVALNGSNKS